MGYCPRLDIGRPRRPLDSSRPSRGAFPRGKTGGVELFCVSRWDKEPPPKKMGALAEKLHTRWVKGARKWDTWPARCPAQTTSWPRGHPGTKPPLSGWGGQGGQNGGQGGKTDRKPAPQDPALKRAQNGCKLSGHKWVRQGEETPQNAIQAACSPPVPRFSR